MTQLPEGHAFAQPNTFDLASISFTFGTLIDADACVASLAALAVSLGRDDLDRTDTRDDILEALADEGWGQDDTFTLGELAEQLWFAHDGSVTDVKDDLMWTLSVLSYEKGLDNDAIIALIHYGYEHEHNHSSFRDYWLDLLDMVEKGNQYPLNNVHNYEATTALALAKQLAGVS